MAPSKAVLKARGRILHAIRRYFVDHGFSEVETPVRISTPALEEYIDAEPSGDHWLRTSPEFHMKRLLADGWDRIFQMGPCFRRGERGRLHHPEYTMLEWYRVDADYMDILADTKAMLGFVAREVLGDTGFKYGGRRVELLPVWDCIPVSEAFLLNAGWDPVASFDANRFDMDLVEKVEPALTRDHPVVLKDYPVAAGAMARPKPGRPEVAERWELYVGGLELANAFTELTDESEQRRRFAEWARVRRQRGREVYALDEPFLAALRKGLPPCAGIALGVDRLVMLLTGANTIDDVTAFSE